jgi:hypothetical protein
VWQLVGCALVVVTVAVSTRGPAPAARRADAAEIDTTEDAPVAAGR